MAVGLTDRIGLADGVGLRVGVAPIGAVGFGFAQRLCTRERFAALCARPNGGASSKRRGFCRCKQIGEIRFGETKGQLLAA